MSCSILPTSVSHRKLLDLHHVLEAHALHLHLDGSASALYRQLLDLHPCLAVYYLHLCLIESYLIYIHVLEAYAPYICVLMANNLRPCLERS